MREQLNDFKKNYIDAKKNLKENEKFDSETIKKLKSKFDDLIKSIEKNENIKIIDFFDFKSYFDLINVFDNLKIENKDREFCFKFYKKFYE